MFLGVSIPPYKCPPTQLLAKFQLCFFWHQANVDHRIVELKEALVTFGMIVLVMLRKAKMATFSLKQQKSVFVTISIACISSLCLRYFCDKVDNDNN